MSADSGWPCPDIRWHEPQANRIPAPPVTARGAAGCSSGNQSGGLALPPILAASYSFALPGALMIPSILTAVGCTLSGMLKAQSGSPAGTLSSACALTSRTMRSGASAPRRIAMRTDLFARRMRRITADLLCDWQQRSAAAYPGEGDSVYRRRRPRRPSLVSCRLTGGGQFAILHRMLCLAGERMIFDRLKRHDPMRLLDATAARLMLLAVLSFAAADARADGSDGKYPDIGGGWARTGRGGNTASWDPTKPAGAQQAPLTPEYQAVLDASLAERAPGGQNYNPAINCLPAGMPRIMVAYDPLEIIITPDVTYIRSDHLPEMRRIY